MFRFKMFFASTYIPLPLRNNLPIDLLLIVIVPAYNDNGFVADAEILVPLILGVGAEAIEVVVKAAEHIADIFAGDDRSTTGADRVPLVGPVKGMWFGFLDRHGQCSIRRKWLSHRKEGGEHHLPLHARRQPCGESVVLSGADVVLL